MKLTSALFPASNRALATLTVVSFLLAAVGRFAFIGFTPMSESFIDLVIYMSGGRIVSHGLNPYDSTEGSEFRRKLRAEYAQAQPWLTETQERFDFYASGNLPLNLMFFGAIDHFLPGNPYAYRAAFALADSLLSALVVCFVFRVWRVAPSVANLLLAAGLGVFSPILFFCGVLQPEDKGLEILLLLSAVCFAWLRRWVLSAFLLAASIAYKGVGVFIAPLCLWYAAARPGVFPGVAQPPGARAVRRLCGHRRRRRDRYLPAVPQRSPSDDNPSSVSERGVGTSATGFDLAPGGCNPPWALEGCRDRLHCVLHRAQPGWRFQKTLRA